MKPNGIHSSLPHNKRQERPFPPKDHKPQEKKSKDMSEFYCFRCGRMTISRLESCEKCGSKDGEATSIPSTTYRCYLNGEVYGVGSLEYMNELFKDYVVNFRMYGNEECTFRIEKCQ